MCKSSYRRMVIWEWRVGENLINERGEQSLSERMLYVGEDVRLWYVALLTAQLDAWCRPAPGFARDRPAPSLIDQDPCRYLVNPWCLEHQISQWWHQFLHIWHPALLSICLQPFASSLQWFCMLQPMPHAGGFSAAACNFCETQLSCFWRIFLAFLKEAITCSAWLSFSCEFLALDKASFVCMHGLSLVFSTCVSLQHVLCSKHLHSNTQACAIWRAEFDGPELPEWELLPSEKPPEEEISFSLLPALILAIDRQVWALWALEWAIRWQCTYIFWHTQILSSRHVNIAFLDTNKVFPWI